MRYQKAIPGPDIELGELRVFTEFSVREISRNKPAAADSSTVLSAEKGNDGLNEGNGDAWVSAGDAAFRYWQVDLEKSYPIDLIEIEEETTKQPRAIRRDGSCLKSTEARISGILPRPRLLLNRP